MIGFRDGDPHGDWAPGPWEYNDPEKFSQGHGKLSETAVYAAGNVFPWRMAEVAGPNERCEIATARLISASPEGFSIITQLEESFTADGAYQQFLPAMRAYLAKVRGAVDA